MAEYRGNVRRKKEKKEKKFLRRMQSRLLVAFCAIVVLFIGLIGRIWFLTEKDGERYAKRVLSQQTYVSNEIPYQRGDIVDRNQTKLATSTAVYNLIIAPKTILEAKSTEKNVNCKEVTIQSLAQYFDVTEEELNKILEEKPNSQYTIVLKELDYDTVTAFEEIQENNKNIVGVWFEKKYKRKYPLKDIACDVIGFTTSDNTGLWGLEGYYNDELNGTAGREYGYYDADLKLERNVKSAINGNTLVTTIDANIQQIVQNKISDFMKETGGKNIAALVMNPNNGEIYAMSSQTTYDLNDPFDLTQVYDEKDVKNLTEEEKTKKLNEMWGNFCISSGYEPGSTFKPLTIAAALEENKTYDDEWFMCNGGEEVGGRWIKCVSRSGHGPLTLEGLLMESCNDGLMQIANRLGRSLFAKYQRNFNMGQKTGIDLPGEAYGLIHSEENLNSQELATSSFGQGLTTTMVQMASAISSVINGGNYYQPHVVKQILNDNGAVVKNISPVLVRKTISEDTSALIRKYMYATVEEGTGSAAQISGYSIGGKTGTAEKVPRGHGNYLVSFMGFAPVDKPQVVVYVIVDEPNVPDQAHSYIATNIVNEIMKDIFPFLDIYPDRKVKDTDTVTGGAVSAKATEKPKESGKPDETEKPTGTPAATAPPSVTEEDNSNFSFFDEDDPSAAQIGDNDTVEITPTPIAIPEQ